MILERFVFDTVRSRNPETFEGPDVSAEIPAVGEDGVGGEAPLNHQVVEKGVKCCIESVFFHFYLTGTGSGIIV